MPQTLQQCCSSLITLIYSNMERHAEEYVRGLGSPSYVGKVARIETFLGTEGFRVVAFGSMDYQNAKSVIPRRLYERYCALGRIVKLRCRKAL